jgi:hypothetical protein
MPKTSKMWSCFAILFGLQQPPQGLYLLLYPLTLNNDLTLVLPLLLLPPNNSGRQCSRVSWGVGPRPDMSIPMEASHFEQEWSCWLVSSPTDVSIPYMVKLSPRRMRHRQRFSNASNPLYYARVVQWRPGEILTGAINHSRGLLHGSYKKSLPCGVQQVLFCMAKMRYFRGTGMIFPRFALH